MERTHYFALENVGAAEVCAVVKNDPECAVAFAFDVRFSTEDDSAGTLHHFFINIYFVNQISDGVSSLYLQIPLMITLCCPLLKDLSQKR